MNELLPTKLVLSLLLVCFLLVTCDVEVAVWINRSERHLRLDSPVLVAVSFRKQAGTNFASVMDLGSLMWNLLLEVEDGIFPLFLVAMQFSVF